MKLLSFVLLIIHLFLCPVRCSLGACTSNDSQIAPATTCCCCVESGGGVKPSDSSPSHFPVSHDECHCVGCYCDGVTLLQVFVVEDARLQFVGFTSLDDRLPKKDTSQLRRSGDRLNALDCSCGRVALVQFQTWRI
ncbi:MAG: hypothetical protein AAF802_29015 [Planctomycetota bacterium]